MSGGIPSPSPAPVETQVSWACPDATLVLSADAPRDTWLIARRRGIGGSDASTIAGVNRYSSPYALWLDKTGQRDDEDVDSDAMEWGRRLEPVIAEWFVDHTGISVRRAGLMASRTRPWQLASVDRLTRDGGILEIKTTTWRLEDDWSEEQVADHAEVQTQHYLAVTGRSHAWVVALVDGRKPLLRRVERDEELINTLNMLEQSFWQINVLGRLAPGMTASALPAVKARFASARVEQVVGDSHQVPALLAELSDRKQEVRDAQAAADVVEGQLRLLMEHADELVVAGDVVATCRANGTFAASRFEAAHPDIAEDCRKTVTVLDVERVKTEWPQEYGAHRARVLRAVKAKKRKA